MCGIKFIIVNQSLQYIHISPYYRHSPSCGADFKYDSGVEFIYFKGASYSLTHPLTMHHYIKVDTSIPLYSIYFTKLSFLVRIVHHYTSKLIKCATAFNTQVEEKWVSKQTYVMTSGKAPCICYWLHLDI